MSPIFTHTSKGLFVKIRPITKDDKNKILDGFKRLSQQSRYNRFLGVRSELSEKELDFLSNPDGRRHVALAIAILGDDQKETPAGVARFIVNESLPSEAELGITIMDEFQGQGLGEILLKALIEQAKSLHIKKFTGQIDASNKAMIHLISKIPELKTTMGGHGILELGGSFC